jgi:hypothetical protein
LLHHNVHPNINLIPRVGESGPMPVLPIHSFDSQPFCRAWV